MRLSVAFRVVNRVCNFEAAGAAAFQGDELCRVVVGGNYMFKSCKLVCAVCGLRYTSGACHIVENSRVTQPISEYSGSKENVYSVAEGFQISSQLLPVPSTKPV